VYPLLREIKARWSAGGNYTALKSFCGTRKAAGTEADN
jgi:hypothetical protein